jgi:hypothetical protein
VRKEQKEGGEREWSRREGRKRGRRESECGRRPNHDGAGAEGGDLKAEGKLIS